MMSISRLQSTDQDQTSSSVHFPPPTTTTPGSCDPHDNSSSLLSQAQMIDGCGLAGGGAGGRAEGDKQEMQLRKLTQLLERNNNKNR